MEPTTDLASYKNHYDNFLSSKQVDTIFEANILTSYRSRYNNFLLRRVYQYFDDHPGSFLEVRSLLIAFLILLNAFWAVPCVLLIRCLRPWRIIRLGKFNEHIGHLVMDAGIQWSKKQLQSNRYLDFYCLPMMTVSNHFWAKMIRRNFLVCPWFLFVCVDHWNRKLPGGDVHVLRMPLDISFSADVQGWLQKTHDNMPFLHEEDAEAKAWLRRQGWQEGEPFVCLIVRDAAYKGSQLGSSDHRNSDIATYVPAAEWLAEQGVWVLRMGKSMARPMPTSHSRIIDYAFHPEKSDFLDIWLFAHCDLCISTGTGADSISSVYCRPQLVLNYIPLQLLMTWNDAMHLSKTLVWGSSGTPLTWREYVNMLNLDALTSDFFIEADIQIINLTSEEILAAVQERWQRIQGTWVDTEADRDRHNRFWEILLKESPNFARADNWKHPEWIHPECRVGSTWLRSMGDAFLA